SYLFADLVRACDVFVAESPTVTLCHHNRLLDPERSPCWSTGGFSTRRLSKGGLDELGSFHIHVGLEHGSTQSSEPVQDHVHVSLVIEDEESRGSRLHQAFNLVDETLADSDRGGGGSGARARYQRTYDRAREWSPYHQAREEAHCRGSEDIVSGRK